MSGFSRFEDIDAWKLGRSLAVQVYRATQAGSFARDYGLRDQIQRAAVSVTSNIAEGFERRSSAEFARFLLVARGSAGEVRSQRYLALDLDDIDHDTFTALSTLAARISRATDALARHLRDHPKRVYEPEAEYLSDPNPEPGTLYQTE